MQFVVLQSVTRATCSPNGFVQFGLNNHGGPWARWNDIWFSWTIISPNANVSKKNMGVLGWTPRGVTPSKPGGEFYCLYFGFCAHTIISISGD